MEKIIHLTIHAYLKIIKIFYENEIFISRIHLFIHLFKGNSAILCFESFNSSIHLYSELSCLFKDTSIQAL